MLVTVAFLDGQFGFLSAAPRACVTIAPAISGTLNQLTPETAKQPLLDIFTGGQLVDTDAFQLANGSGTAYALRIGTSTAGAFSAVVPTLQPLSDGALALSGTPTDFYKSVIVKVTAAGLVAVTPPKIQISWDGGLNFSPEVQVPIGGVYVPTEPPVGLTLTFTNGAVGFKVGDLFRFSTTGPAWSNTDLTNALDALRADETSDWEFFHVVGPSNSAAFAVVISEINLMRQDGRFVWALLEARDQNVGEAELTWMNSIKADFNTSVAAQGQIVVVAGYGYMTSAVSGRVYWRSLGQTVAARVTNTADYAEHWGLIDGGPLPGLVKGPDGLTVSHDERKVPGLAQARFLTVATVVGQLGYFVGDPARFEPATFAALLSDYRKAMFMRVAMRVANLVVQIGSKTLGKKIETNRNGTISDRFARETELTMQKQLAVQTVPADLQGVDIQIDRKFNIKTGERIPVKVIMDSYAYAEQIDFTIAFLNPNLVS
jgi:hypothetical protein